MRSFYGRGFPIQEIAHSFLPITLYQKRCTPVHTVVYHLNLQKNYSLYFSFYLLFEKMVLYYNVQGIVQEWAKCGPQEHFVQLANTFETLVKLIYNNKWRNNCRITEARKRYYMPH